MTLISKTVSFQMPFEWWTTYQMVETKWLPNITFHLKNQTGFWMVDVKWLTKWPAMQNLDKMVWFYEDLSGFQIKIWITYWKSNNPLIWTVLNTVRIRYPDARYPESLDIRPYLCSDIEFWPPSCFLEWPISGPDIKYIQSNRKNYLAITQPITKRRHLVS
jgi:hypothetical protein